MPGPATEHVYKTILIIGATVPCEYIVIGHALNYHQLNKQRDVVNAVFWTAQILFSSRTFGRGNPLEC